jgi:hypothetical protein
MKRAYDNISNDRNIPGLRVCNYGCNDERDPYRLPARQPEKISIRFPRPDAPIGEDDQALTTDPNIVNNPDQDKATPVTAGQSGIAPEKSQDSIDGNLDNLSP